MRTYKGLINELPENCVFVYGANPEGIHGAGAAKVAREKFGAVYGKTGWVGKSYSLITKDLRINKHPSIPEKEIKWEIDDLYITAAVHSDKDFYIAYTGNGTNLNGYTNQQMADMFSSCGVIPDNIIFEEEFAKLLKDGK